MRPPQTVCQKSGCRTFYARHLVKWRGPKQQGPVRGFIIGGLAVGRQLPPNSTNSVHSYLRMLPRTFAERCLNSRQSIKCDVLLHQQSWRSSNPNPAVEPKPTSLPMANLALERNSAFMDSHQPVRSHAPKPSISIKEILPRAGMSVRRR